MKREKVKVWWQKLDAEGNVIESGCDDREYLNYGSAINRAEKLFGKGRFWRPSISNETPKDTEPKIRWRIAHRDPWVEYYGDYECDICGIIHKRKESEYGHDIGDNFRLNLVTDPNKYRYGYRICPACAEKLSKYVDKLAKGGKK